MYKWRQLVVSIELKKEKEEKNKEKQPKSWLDATEEKCAGQCTIDQRNLHNKVQPVSSSVPDSLHELEKYRSASLL